MDIRHRFKNTAAVGEWLENNMPNPPLPDPQRWTIINLNTHYAISFADEHDATWFALVWNDA